MKNIGVSMIFLFVFSSLFGQKRNTEKSYELLSNQRIGDIKGNTDFPNTRFYYRVNLLPDSTFEYLYYKKVAVSENEGKHIDSLYVKGEYSIVNTHLELKHEEYFQKGSGINWIIKNNCIVAKGRNTRRFKLKQIK